MRKLFYIVVLFFLFYCKEATTQTYITPLIGAEATTLKENYKSQFISYHYLDPFVDVAIFSVACGIDVERAINERFNLNYGLSYFAFETGKRFAYTSWGPNPYSNIKFNNFNQNLGMIYYIFTNLGAGFAINIDYITDFKTKRGSSVSPDYQVPYSSLIYLGYNLNLRYVWRNFVIKVDYKRGVFDVNNGNKKVVDGIRNPFYPQKGFGFYLGYRFSF